MSGNCKTCKHNNGKQVVSKGEEPCYSCLTADKAFLKYEAKSNITNADRIRAMTDEELAEFMCHNVSNGTVNCEFCAVAEFCRMGHNGWIDWLKQEASGWKKPFAKAVSLPISASPGKTA